MSGKIVNLHGHASEAALKSALTDSTPQDQQQLQERLKESIQNASREIKHEVKSNVEKTAKKDIPCAASQWLRIGLNEEVFNKMTPEEQEVVGRARRNEFMIKKGDKFIRQVGLYDGKQYVAKFMLDVMQIVDKYKLQIK